MLTEVAKRGGVAPGEELRICRISRLHPRTSWPASGLTAYNLSRDLPYRSLYIAKDLGDEPLPFPEHVQLEVVTYPEPTVPQQMGRLATAVVAAGKMAGSLVLVIRALPYILDFRPHLIHVHTPLTLAPGIAGKLLTGCPLVLTFQGTDFFRFRSSRALQRLVYRWVDTVVAVSEEMQRSLQELLPGRRVVCMPNGVDTEQFQDLGWERSEQVVAVGRLVWQKGYPDLLEAMQQVVMRRPECRLVILGDGPLEEALSEQARRLGLGDRVTLAGKASAEEVRSCLNRSKVYALSSVTEGLPKAMLEAMACGTPVVVTDVGDCARIAEGAGRVVPPADPGALARAIVELLGDEAARRSCARQARATALGYGWRQRAGRMLAEYRRLLQPGAVLSVELPEERRGD